MGKIFFFIINILILSFHFFLSFWKVILTTVPLGNNFPIIPEYSRIPKYSQILLSIFIFYFFIFFFIL